MNNGLEDGPKSAAIDAEKAMSVMETIVRALGPLNSEERRRLVQAALVILGDAPISTVEMSRSTNEQPGDEVADIAPRARQWMRQNGLSEEQLSHVFDISGGVATVIASGVAGKNNAEKTVKAYFLAGVSTLLVSGDPVFDDKSARELCISLGCYDSTNHSKYMKEMGNNFTGSKDKGWKLTAPGLKSAATVVREMAQG